MAIFDFAYALKISDDLLWAFRINILATLAAFVIAAVAGLLLELMRRSGSRVLRGVAIAYIEFVRSTPLLVQLFFLYYVLPQYGITLGALEIGITAIGLHYACYLAEVYRAGLDEIPRTQWEAAVALNYRPAEIWGRIILPQAIPPVIPVLGNYLISMLKETPLLAVITVADAMQRASILGAQSYQYLEPVSLVGLMMLITSLILAGLVRLLDARLQLRVTP
jgi:polar amino acid transport system permease protein